MTIPRSLEIYASSSLSFEDAILRGLHSAAAILNTRPPGAPHPRPVVHAEEDAGYAVRFRVMMLVPETEQQ